MIRALLILFLSAASGVLIWWNLQLSMLDLETSPIIDVAVPVASSDVPPSLTGLNDLDEGDAPKTSAGVQTLARPLLHADRRPFVAPVEQPRVAVAAPLPDTSPAPVARRDPPLLKILGTSGSTGNMRALIQHADEASIWISVGQLIDGWTLAKIQAGSVVFSNGDDTHQVDMFTDDAGSPEIRVGRELFDD